MTESEYNYEYIIFADFFGEINLKITYDKVNKKFGIN